jgi:hypothetical protein
MPLRDGTLAGIGGSGLLACEVSHEKFAPAVPLVGG